MKKTLTLCFLLALVCLKGWGQAPGTYIFSTNATGTLVTDKNGNTITATGFSNSIVAAGSDDVASSVISFGFTFPFAGSNYTQFSASSNGAIRLGAVAISGITQGDDFPVSAQAIIAPYLGDIKIGSSSNNGSIKWQITGSFPNRALVVQFNNMGINANSSTADGTFQLRLYETSGVIELVYGNMKVGSSSTNNSSRTVAIGISSTTGAGNNISVNQSTYSTSTSATPITNNNSATGNIIGLNSSTDGSRRTFIFTPLLTAPILTAAGATVDAPFNVTFTDNPIWRAAITSITVGGTALPANVYTITNGQITFDPSKSSLLQSTGFKSIAVFATGYSNATVSQPINPGIPASLTLSTQPTAPTVSGGTLATQPAVTVKDQYGNAVLSGITINAAVASGQSTAWTLGGTVTATTNTSGIATFSGLTATNNTSPSAPYSGNITFTPGAGTGTITSNAFTIPGIYPALTAATGATVDAPFIVTFADNPIWRSAITSITVGGTALPANAYSTTTAGQITFTPASSALLQSAGSKNIVVIATGYANDPLAQVIGAGSATALSMSTQPVAPASNGAALGTQPVVKITDQYGNTTNNTANITATVSGGTWTIGGTTTIVASAGIVSFTNITAATGSGSSTLATITFTSGTLTPVTSNSFTIPGATINTGVISGSPFCIASTVNISFTSNGIFSGNTYTAQLSNSSGTFPASPTGIGSLVSDMNSGTITATIPAGTTAGTSYKIRVVSNSPVVTGSNSATTITINTPVTITAQPVYQATCASTSKTFNVTTTSTPTSYQWQYSANGTSGWANVANGMPTGISYTAFNNSLTVATSTSTAGGSYFYRSIIMVSGCSVLTSDTASLLVYATPSASAGSDQTICATGSATLAASASPAAASGTWSISSGPSTSLLQFSDIHSASSIFTPDKGAGTYVLTWAVSNGTCAIRTDNVNITVNAPPSVTGQPQSQTICAGNTNGATFSLSGVSGTSPTYQWQYSSDGGNNYTNLSNGSLGTYTISGAMAASLKVTPASNSSSAVTYLRCIVSVANCSSYTSQSATLTVNALPTVTVSPTSATVCAGISTQLKSAGADTYTWSPSAGLSLTSGNQITATPSSTTTYSVTGTATATGCANTATSTITVNPLPTSLSVTPTDTAICSGGSAILKASATMPSTVAGLSENFDGTSSFTSAGNSYGNHSQIWASLASGSTINSIATFTSPNGGNLMVATAATSNFFSNASVASTLTSSTINTTGYSSLSSLTFNHTYNQGDNGTGTVEVSINGGTSWSTLITYSSNKGSSSSFVPESINMTSYVNVSNLKIRFNLNSSINYFSNNTSWWAIDDVQLNGVSLPLFSWTASPSGITAGLPIAAGTPSNTNKSISVTPTTTTAYTLTATSNNGCSAATVNSSVVVHPLPTDNLQIVALPSSVCQGGATSVIISGGTLNDTVYYSIDNGSAQSAVIGSGGNVTINTPTYNSAGTHTYTLLSESNASGCSINENGSATVTVNPLPSVSSITGKSYVAIGNTITLSDATQNGTWSINNSSYANLNNTTANPVTVTGAAAGTPTVTYKTALDANGCSDSASFPINVYDPTIAGYRTIATGNFSNPSIWEVNAGGTNWDVASTAPGGNNSIEVRHDLVLDQDYTGSATASFSITSFTGADGSFTIAPNHYFSSLGAVNFNDKAVLVHSDSTGTGAIGYMANAISGATHVTAERYIPLYVDANLNRAGRSWRLLTAPVTGTTINAAWQGGQLWNGDENNHPAATGYGTLITGYQQGSAANANSHGYDYWDYIQRGNSSIRYYSLADNATSGTWADLPGNGLKDANGNFISIDSYPAYLLFIRGDRSQTSPPASGATTLRPTGTLNQISKTTTVSGTKNFTLVGNPFASMIDFEQIYNASHNIKSQYWVWNAKNNIYGGFDLIQRQGVGSYTKVPFPFTDGTGIQDNDTRYIESGQGFFVQPNDTTTDGSVLINENAKVNAQKPASVFRENNYLDKKLYVNLNLLNPDSSAILADGVLARYDKSYSRNIDGDDVTKAYNMYENLSIGSHSSYLIVEARPDIQLADTLQLKLWNTTQRSYQLQMKTDRFDSTIALKAWLEDTYLHSKTQINLYNSITTINFNVTSDTASQALNRFRIVFKNEATLLPITLTNVKAVPQNGGVSIAWTVSNEVNIKDYTIERSIDGGRSFNAITTVDAKNLASSIFTNYNGFDANPEQGENLYRIRMESKAGNISYSGVVRVTIGDDKKEILITFYPNPVKNGIANLQLNNLAQGSYLVSVYSSSGQNVYQKKITITESNTIQSEQLRLSNELAEGSYNLHITDDKGVTIYSNQFVIAR